MPKKSDVKVLGVIPARLHSARIPKKMLADLCGKPLIAWTIERTKKARSLDALVVATDDESIAEVVRPLGVPVIMTPPELPTGTDRAAAAAQKFSDFQPDIIVNIWGDEPLFSHEAIDKCVALLKEDPALEVSGVGDLLPEELLNEPSIVKVLTDLNNNVLSFSRAPVPYAYSAQAPIEHYHVIGVMAMRREFLYRFLTLPQTPIERREGVEQMRILEHGIRMRIVKGDYKNLGVNTQDELETVRSIFSARLKGGR